MCTRVFSNYRGIRLHALHSSPLTTRHPSPVLPETPSPSPLPARNSLRLQLTLLKPQRTPVRRDGSARRQFKTAADVHSQHGSEIAITMQATHRSVQWGTPFGEVEGRWDGVEGGYKKRGKKGRFFNVQQSNVLQSSRTASYPSCTVLQRRHLVGRRARLQTAAPGLRAAPSAASLQLPTDLSEYLGLVDVIGERSWRTLLSNAWEASMCWCAWGLRASALRVRVRLFRMCACVYRMLSPPPLSIFLSTLKHSNQQLTDHASL